MTQLLPPLNALRVFEAAARHLSFTKAAAELGMTQAAVSYQIKLLEDRAGAAMFQRMTRKLVLTEAGAKLAPAVSEAFGKLQHAFASLSSDAGGVLAITAVTTFTTNWLVPRIGQFQMACPQIAVRLDASTRMVDFTREPFDVGIRGGRIAHPHWPGLATHLLGRMNLVPMCCPSLLQRLGPVETAADILKLPLIGETDLDWPGAAKAEPDWLRWFKVAGVEFNAPPETRADFATQQMVAASVLSGHGAGLLTPEFFTADIQAGRLVPLSPVSLEGLETYYLVYLEARRDVPKIKAFREWLLATLEGERSTGVGLPTPTRDSATV